MDTMVHECEGILTDNNAEAVPSRVDGQTVYVVASAEELKSGVQFKLLDLIPYPIKFMTCVKPGTMNALQELVVQAMIPKLRVSCPKGESRTLVIEMGSGEYQPDDKTRYAELLGQSISRLLELDGFPKRWTVKLDGGVIAER